MSSRSKILLQKTAECYQRKDVSGLRDAFNEYQACNCYNPLRLRVFDAHTQTYVKRFLPCGKCYHCLETKINSWVTRMYAHLEDFKHVYFVTLTYRSLTTIREIEQLMLDKLSQAVWLLDDKNYNKHMSYNPSLLVKSHYQNFLKRLRKNTGFDDITYVLCGEYGSTYGRPHFHVLLFSNSEISKADIVSAWSIALWRDNFGSWSYRRNQRYNGTAYNFPIGRVDYHDLITNGTLNTSAKIKVDGTYMNAANCFAYVCKYVCKQDSYNKSRVVSAYNNLFAPEIMCTSFGGVCPLHVALEEYKFLDVYKQTLIQNSYEEMLFSPTDKIVGKLFPNVRASLYGHQFVKEFFPNMFKDFCDTFAPFVEFSRGCPIGSVYAERHLSEFKEGVFNRPLLQDKGFVVPLYFRYKAQNSIYGLRKMRKTIRGYSFAKTGLVDLYRRFESDMCDVVPLAERVPSYLSSTPYNELLKNDFYTFKDLGEKSRVILCAGRAMSFRYDRRIREYVKVNQMPIADWIRLQLDKLSNDFKLYKSAQRDSQQTLKETELSFFYCAKMGYTYKRLNKTFVEQQNEYLRRGYEDYRMLHVDTQ